ncbi:MAG: imidazole glycerol phosphate synthase subunit HisH [Chloroflexota bacterium]
MLAVIDYGAGNLRSVMHALGYLKAKDVKLVQSPSDMDGAQKIILPGVGAFGAGIQKLHEQALVEPIKVAIANGVPYFGICLGMQFLFERSDEMGDHEGFGVLSGKVTRFEDRPGLKVPHMGWNALQPRQTTSLLDGLPDPSFAYFVHSYYCVPDDESDVLITADYGEPFTAGVQRDNVYGVQFHPEKSQRTGLRILKNFLEMPI